MLHGGARRSTASGLPPVLRLLCTQIQDKMRQKRALQAATEKQARREASLDETDKLRQALRGGKKQGKQKGGGKAPSKGFGS
jgi:phage gp16-like protein